MSEDAPGKTPNQATHTTLLAEFARHPWLTALAIVAIAVIVLVLLWDWNWFKGPIERQVESRTGREFDIGGDLDVDLGRTTTIRAQRLRFGNADWSKAPDMATARELQFGVRVWPLLRGQVRIPDIRLDTPRLRLEKGPKGVGNWVFGTQGESNVEFRGLRIRDGRLRFIDPAAKTDVDVAVSSGKPGKTRPHRRSTSKAVAAGRAMRSRSKVGRNHRWTCATSSVPIASTHARRQARPAPTPAARCSTPCSCATST